MKIFLSILILIFTFQSWTQAEDIKDFEIEGISLYDSALLHFTESELKANIANYYTSDKYFTSAIFKTFKDYDYLQLSFKKNDSKYIIQDLSGSKTLSYSKCLNKLKDIKKQISSLYENSSKIINREIKYNHPIDKSGETKITDVYWSFNDGDVIVIQCYNWQSKYGKKRNYEDELKIAISNKDINTWLQGEAFE